ncbi:MAG: hypothetical protein V8R50_06035 [Clostridia bacterium]
MKTIELKAGQQIAQFTTKSVTFDGKEFFYSRMSNLTHDPATQKYYFTYDGESKILPYEAKDAQILTAIFSQVLKLQAAKAAQAHAAKVPAQTAQQTPQAPVQDQAQQEEIPVTPQTPHAVDVRAAAEMAQPAPEPAEQAPQQQNRLRQKNRSCSPIRKPPSRQRKSEKKQRRLRNVQKKNG